MTDEVCVGGRCVKGLRGRMNNEGKDGFGVGFDGVQEGPGRGGDGVDACTARFIARNEGELRVVVTFLDEA